MGLYSKPSSPDAELLIANAATHMHDQLRLHARLTPSEGKALGAITADLLKAASYDPPRSCFRPMGVADFTNGPIGFRPFKQVLKRLERCNYITIERGFCDPTWRKRGKVTRIKATAQLIDLAAEMGITPANRLDHFAGLPRPAVIAEPIKLKSASVTEKGQRREGKAMHPDMTNPKVITFAGQVNDLNAYLAKQVIEGGEHRGFQRLFNQGDLPGFDYNKGGRLYSIGGGYQTDPKDQRRCITVNGAAMVEIDIQASFLTILYAKAGAKLPAGDPYAIPGLPRHVVKAWITMTLGHDGFQRAWSPKVKARYNEADPKALQREYPIKQVRSLITDHLPLLADWPNSKVRWGDLQYLESCAIIDAVYSLCIRWNIPALPVHDSIVVPVSSKGMAKLLLRSCFQEHVGVDPVLTEK